MSEGKMDYTILICIIVSYIVSKFSVKSSFDAIDNYVKEMTEELYDALRELTDFSRKSK